jgi:hypothetical protein
VRLHDHRNVIGSVSDAECDVGRVLLGQSNDISLLLGRDSATDYRAGLAPQLKEGFFGAFLLEDEAECEAIDY